MAKVTPEFKQHKTLMQIWRRNRRLRNQFVEGVDTPFVGNHRYYRQLHTDIAKLAKLLLVRTDNGKK